MIARAFALTAIVLTVAGWAIAQNGAKDLEKLQGRWRADKGDKAVTAEFKFEKNQFTIILAGKQAFKGTFKIDPSKKPKHMDLTVTEGEKFKGATALAIYDLDGDTLKWCASEPGKKTRPEEFSEKGDAKCVVLKRAK